MRIAGQLSPINAAPSHKISKNSNHRLLKPSSSPVALGGNCKIHLAISPNYVKTHPQRREYIHQAAEGGGDSGGGNDDGWGGNGDDNNNYDDGPRSNSPPWLLITAVAAALGLYGVEQKLKSNKYSSSKHSVLLPASESDEVDTLKRLLQDTFKELNRLRNRLENVESSTGISSSSSSNGLSGVTPVHHHSTNTSSRSTSAGGTSGSNSRADSVVNGSLEVGGGLLWADEEVENNSGESVKETGVRLGTDLLFRIGSRVRHGADLVMAECKIDPTMETMTLQKVLYNLKLSDFMRVVLSPFGAKGQDVAYTLNPVAGRGLTALAKHGSPVHQRVLGSLIGAAIDMKHAWFSLGYFARQDLNDGGDDLLTSTASFYSRDANYSTGTFRPVSSFLGQAVIEALPGLSVGVTCLDTIDPLLSDSSGEKVQGNQLAGTFALRVPMDMAINGWTSIDAPADWFSTSKLSTAISRPRDWGLVMSSQQTGSLSGWLIAMGHLAPLGPASERASARGAAPTGVVIQEPNMFEISAQMDLGQGMHVMPGLVVLRQMGKSTLFAGCRAAWNF